MKITDEIYEEIAQRMLSKGVSPKEAYKLLEKAGFTVKLDGETYTHVYASRVMALMHNSSTNSKALEL